MSKRISKRVEKKLMVSFSENGFDRLGVTGNLSKAGIRIASNEEIEPTIEISISLAIPGQVVNLKGEVVWCKKAGTNESDIPDNMGIKILEAPSEYIKYVEEMKKKQDLEDSQYFENTGNNETAPQ